MPKRTHDGLKKRCAHKRKSWNDCDCPWWFGFHHGGREYRYSLTKLALARVEKPPVTKDDALVWRDRLRTEIGGGTFVEPDTITGSKSDPVIDTRLTFGDVCEEYIKRHARTPTRRPKGRKMMEILVAVLRRAEIPAAGGSTVRLEQKPIDAITKADVEAVRTWRRAELAAGKSRPGAKGGEAGINRLLSRLRHVFNWAIAEGYLSATPFKRGPVTVVKIDRTIEHARTRRLDAEGEENEERRLLAHADPHLRAVLIAALTTGCRIGEILSLQWSQIRRDDAGEARWLVLPAPKTKTAETRVIPIGADLRAVLSLRRHAPDGTEHPRTAYVFGTETGEQVTSIRRQWEDAALLAHGHTPIRARGKLTVESRAVLASINLHVHDLRREFASRLLEASADLHDVQLFLGHSTITTTSRYLQSTPTRLARALDKLEAAGFAHHSHTEEKNGSASEPISEDRTAANVLN
jgi:integrase